MANPDRLVHLSDAQWAQIDGSFPQRRGRSGFERKSYRGIATRDDKLAAMFLGGVLAALLAVSLRCIVNTP